MALDELVVSIRYQADLRSFNDALATAERQTGAAVARMVRVLGSLHQPFNALFKSLAQLDGSAKAITLPNHQIEAFQTLTAQIETNTASLKANLDGVRNALTLLRPDIEGAIAPLTDPQLEKNLQALAGLLEGGAGDQAGSGFADNISRAIAFMSAVALLYATRGRVAKLKDLIPGAGIGFELENIVGFLEHIFSSNNEIAASAEDVLARFSNMANLTSQWADSQERISIALKPAVEAYQSIEASLKSIKDNAADLPTFGFGSGTGGGGILRQPRGSNLEERALGGPVYPGLAFLVGERGPEIFVPDRAGRILPNGILAGGSGGGLLGDDFDAVIAEIERFGAAMDRALEGMPEEVQRIAESVSGSFIGSLEQGRGVMEAMQRAGREAAGQLLHMLLQIDAVRGELGELADVIENVLNQALNGSIDSWEDLGRVALEVLQAIAEKMVEAQATVWQGSVFEAAAQVQSVLRRSDGDIEQLAAA